MVAALSAFTPVVAFSNFKSTGVFGIGDHTLIVKPLFVTISIGVSNPKFTPAKPAFAGTVFSATVAEVFTPVTSGFSIAWVNDPLKSPKTGN